ncbi:uncharacterized protein LOC126681754 [Mercurialis annua]|uniref:uncharacterized protein LOC126681754 n=1 Tax=Mercurialis annua TaxID=3986 RepID=UPI00215F65FE|nr:uncharacterized protein LOC126681754 [Mercurialis annua]
MDKSWMKHKNKFSSEYIQGVRNFLDVAKVQADCNGRIRCPCKRCNNCYFKSVTNVRRDLFQNGILEDYTTWVHHGETSQVDNTNDDIHNQVEDQHDEISEMLIDMQNSAFVENNMDQNNTSHNTSMPEKEMGKFAKLFNDAECKLYPSSKKYSKLSFLVKMMYNKIITNSSIKSFSLNLELFKDALPEGETLPKSYYEVKKLMRDLGLGYITIDACVNDCILYWKEHKDLDKCPNPNCGAPRWKLSLGKRKKIAQKILRYFPLKPRLQRLFMSKESSRDMRWHEEKRQKDDTLRHPADAESWGEFDKEHDWFAKDSRNVRLGLASDGFNPFGNMSTSYSMWPVILTPYNLPPWKCMKEPYLFLSLLIPGKDSPNNNIDVYLRPLIDELNELWKDGIETFDAYANEQFRLHAALLWTINDFPAYAIVSSYSNSFKLIICHENCVKFLYDN